MNSQNWDERISTEAFRLVKMFTRCAMPCLLIVFGFMFEYVYARRWEANGARIIFRRVMSRAILCYAAYLSLAFAGFLTGHHAFGHFITSAFFLSPAINSNIFKYYAILIPVVFVLMWLRFRYGHLYSLMLIAIAIIMAELLTAFIPTVPKTFSHIGSLLFGLGNSWGPSILHALLPVTFGMLVADVIVNKKFSLSFLMLMFLILFSAIILFYEIYLIGFSQFTANMVDITYYRYQNSFVYFAYGIQAFLALWLIAWVVVQVFSESYKNKISLYGGNTFTMFFYGNLLILLLPDFSNKVDFSVSVAGLGMTLLFALLSVNAVELINKKYQLTTAFEHAVFSQMDKVMASPKWAYAKRNRE